MPKVIADFHATDGFRAWQFLFEKRLGWELYRPEGKIWLDKGYYYHPHEPEGISNLRRNSEFDPAIHGKGPNRMNYGQDCKTFRWMNMDQVKDLDLIFCTSHRNEEGMWRFRNEMGLKCPILRYTGNKDEPVDLGKFDLFIPAYLPHYEQYVKTGKKPGVLYHPEFDLEMYKPAQLTEGNRIVRSFVNYLYHHRDPGDPWHAWKRYEGYADHVGALALLHGGGTPPHGIEVQLDVHIDISFDWMGRRDLHDRKTWPSLVYHRGEAPDNATIAKLMQFSNMGIHIKRNDGYGFILHEWAATGRPVVVEQDAYSSLSAREFLQHRETCLFVTGHDPTDKENFKWALQPENNQRMSELMFRRFSENVNFEAESEAIKKLL